MRVFTYCELVEAQHIHDAYLSYDRPKEVRPLIGAGCDQQAAVRPSLHTPSDYTVFVAAIVQRQPTVHDTAYNSADDNAYAHVHLMHPDPCHDNDHMNAISMRWQCCPV